MFRIIPIMIPALEAGGALTMGWPWYWNRTGSTQRTSYSSSSSSVRLPPVSFTFARDPDAAAGGDPRGPARAGKV